MNDTLGHYNGDRLIKQVALRLSGTLQEGDTLARIGGDEFGFALPGLQSRSDAETFAKTIRKSLSTPFVLDNLTLDEQVLVEWLYQWELENEKKAHTERNIDALII